MTEPNPFKPVDPFSVPCKFCGAIAGTQCINSLTGKPVRKFAAHGARVRAAEDALREAG
jgi:hypothetical protein